MAEMSTSERAKILRNTTKGKADAAKYDRNRTARESETKIGSRYFREKDARDAEFAARDKVHSDAVKAKNLASAEAYRAKQSGSSSSPPVTTAEAATTRKPLPQSGQAKPESVPAKKAAAAVSVSTPRKTSGRPKAKGSIGAASNRDLPGRTTIKYADKPKRDVEALRVRSKQNLADSKAAASSRSGAAERMRRMNRNK